jgi:ABC-type bacteriocin/lantibiotic exporter with double-glycine peptidase domain
MPIDLWDHGGMPSPSDRPRSGSFAPLKTLLPFLRPYRGVAAAAITALLVASGAMLALPIALRRVIDVLAAKDAGTTNLIFAGFLAAAAIFAVFAALRFYLVTWLGSAWSRICAPPCIRAWCDWIRCSSKPPGSARCCRA